MIIVMNWLLILCLILAGNNVFAGGNQTAGHTLSTNAQNRPPDTVPSSQQEQMSRAEQVTKALAAAYPRRINRAEYIDNDWAVLIDGTWFFYAEGKLLPKELLDKASDYNALSFYNYTSELPPWREPTPEEAERFRNMTNNRSSDPPHRSHHFYDALWRATTRDESYQRLKSIRFLGNTLLVHHSILEDLSLVEEQIQEAAKTDSLVRSWIASINRLDSWSWRNIADTQTRSFHAYGAAIDILPRSLGGRETYWLWASNHRPEWWNISYNERYHPPDGVIKAFEAFGFVWGGKWLFFDTMHFEYRPEVLILSGMAPAWVR
ncbi:MAG: M15 family metallopeptidase [Treponema sp.]|nr:M15 family metallopeptidase [Treponema sp.]